MDNQSNDLKYQILKNDSIQINVIKNGLPLPIRLFRIISLREIETINGTIPALTIGGFIQSESNLSQTDNSWISQNAKVYQNARLNNSFVTNDSCVFGDSILTDSVISGRVRIWDKAIIKSSKIEDNVDVNTSCELENVYAKNWSMITNNSKVHNVKMSGGSRISNSTVESSTLNDQAEVKSNSFVRNCELSGRVVISNKSIANQTLKEEIELNETVFEG